jgi:hypothetical protein
MFTSVVATEMQQHDETREQIIKRSREILKSRCGVYGNGIFFW